MKSISVTTKMKATVLTSTFLYRMYSSLYSSKLFQFLERVHEIPKCDHSNESYRAVFYRGTVCFVVKSCPNFLNQ